MVEPVAIPQIAGVAWYQREAYAAIRLLMADGESFPGSYDDWLKSAAHQKKQAAARGFYPVRVIIDPEQFREWCQAQGLGADERARVLFCEVQFAVVGGAAPTC
ncbi:hypothetical protein [Plastoroseomonas hellenica]|uniref:Uncharacterized protein n=1 Tax=Plastoroseomonas hellenica TaxID=2687306 RepID=A0ABS5F9E0_9PROT|nr:hypothetical protein [Plastoroseomonas hellenica]MBR0647278.1 hypothetical protein [Plastoroseomonas hellenica]MBR0669160.1 hypothetical protein [Plastoroseomonas hellenica]